MSKPRIFMPRKIGMTGNSLYVTIPQDVIKIHTLRKGQEVAFIIDDTGTVTIDFNYTKPKEDFELR